MGIKYFWKIFGVILTGQLTVEIEKCVVFVDEEIKKVIFGAIAKRHKELIC